MSVSATYYKFKTVRYNHPYKFEDSIEFEGRLSGCLGCARVYAISLEVDQLELLIALKVIDRFENTFYSVPPMILSRLTSLGDLMIAKMKKDIDLLKDSREEKKE